VPHGFEELSDLWHAPLQDYNIPNPPSFKDSKLVSSVGYILSTVMGVIISDSLLYLIGKNVAKD
jgi:hypothetical protein